MQIFHQLRQQATKANVSRNNNNMKKLLPVYTQEIDPNLNPQRTKSKLLKFQINSSERHKRNTSHTSLQNNGLINKIFTTLNHPYTMKIALIKRNLRKNSTIPNHKSSTTKETYQAKPQSWFQISPLDSAQYENISSDNNQQSNK